MKQYLVQVRHYGSTVHREKWWTYKNIEAESPEDARAIALERAARSKVFTSPETKGQYRIDRLSIYDIGRVIKR